MIDKYTELLYLYFSIEFIAFDLLSVWLTIIVHYLSCRVEF